MLGKIGFSLIIGIPETQALRVLFYENFTLAKQRIDNHKSRRLFTSPFFDRPEWPVLRPFDHH
ncbi:MAG: hypothetical protein LCH47_11450 [Proteobacteria bacterium]|nr:hypothetical protein [Pseudomonadota bacterium]